MPSRKFVSDKQFNGLEFRWTRARLKTLFIDFTQRHHPEVWTDLLDTCVRSGSILPASIESVAGLEFVGDTGEAADGVPRSEECEALRRIGDHVVEPTSGDARTAVDWKCAHCAGVWRRINGTVSATETIAASDVSLRGWGQWPEYDAWAWKWGLVIEPRGRDWLRPLAWRMCRRSRDVAPGPLPWERATRRDLERAQQTHDGPDIRERWRDEDAVEAFVLRQLSPALSWREIAERIEGPLPSDEREASKRVTNIQSLVGRVADSLGFNPRRDRRGRRRVRPHRRTFARRARNKPAPTAAEVRSIMKHVLLLNGALDAFRVADAVADDMRGSYEEEDEDARLLEVLSQMFRADAARRIFREVRRRLGSRVPPSKITEYVIRQQSGKSRSFVRAAIQKAADNSR